MLEQLNKLIAEGIEFGVAVNNITIENKLTMQEVTDLIADYDND